MTEMSGFWHLVRAGPPMVHRRKSAAQCYGAASGSGEVCNEASGVHRTSWHGWRGLVGGVSPDIHPAFREGLSEAGFTEGRNVTIESRWTEGHLERLPMTGLQVHLLEATNKEEIERAFSRLVRLGVGALLVNADPFFVLVREHFIALAARHPLSTIYYARPFVEDGGLISYGADIASAFHQCGNYVGKILKGEKPTDLPVQQP